LRRAARADALVLGRGTYEGFSATWPECTGTPYADRINGMPKYVASTTMEATSHPWNATLLEGEAADAVAALKAERGQALLKFGTGAFTRTLLEHRLIDELHLWRFPVIDGSRSPTSALSSWHRPACRRATPLPQSSVTALQAVR
jgi:dihydrofolate reductase